MGFTLRCAGFLCTAAETMLAWPPRMSAARVPDDNL